MNNSKHGLQLGKINLKNYKAYKGDVEIELSRDLKKTITVIHGTMGYGKTAIIGAIYWCLYGESYSEESDSDEHILNIDVFNKLDFDSPVETSVEINLYENNELRYKIRRTMKFTKKEESTQMITDRRISGRISKGINLDETVSLHHLSGDDGNWKFVDDPIRVESAINILFPKSLSKYFLFDAELLNDFFKSRGKHVKDGIEKISGLPIIDYSIVHLKKTAQDIQKEIKDVNLEPHQDIVNLCQRNKESLETKIKQHKHEISIREKNIEDINAYLRSYNNDTIQSTQKAIEELSKDIDHASDALKQYNKLISDWLLKSNVRIRLHDVMKKSMEKCDKWEREGKIPVAVNGLALKNILRGKPPICICGASLNEDTDGHKHIQELLEKNTVDSPVIQNITNGRGHWDTMCEHVQKYSVDLKKFQAKRDEYRTIRSNKREAKKTHEEKIKDVRIEDISQKFHKVKDLTNEKTDLEKELGADENKHDQAVKTLRLENDRLNTAIAKNKKYKSENNRIRLAETLENLFKKYRSDLVIELRSTVAKKTTDYFLKLVSKKHDFSKVEIQDNYDTVVFAKSKGGSISVEQKKSLSAGQFCCLALSYISAIREIAEKNYFMLIDSPFHNISQSERVDIAKNLPNFLPETQITLLVQDQEYTGVAKEGIIGSKIQSVRETLLDEDYLWKEYLLFTNENDEGTSYTTIKEVDYEH